jgi:lipoprotein-releasing system permease protein
MVVREKAAEIAIMRSMGASAQSVLKVFMFQGTLIGAIGTVTGVVIGLAVAYNLGTIVIWIENLLQIQFVAPDVYFISELPSKVEYQDVTRIGTVAFILAVAATIYPALRGAVTNPAQALRHE